MDPRAWYITTAAGATPIGPSYALLDLFNYNGSGKVVRVWKVVFLSTQVRSPQADLFRTVSLKLINNTMGGQRCACTPCVLGLPDLGNKITSSKDSRVSQILSFRLRTYNLTTPGGSYSGTYGSCTWETFIPNAILWEVNPYQTDIEPIVLRPDYGVALVSNNSAPQTSRDAWIEFTVE